MNLSREGKERALDICIETLNSITKAGIQEQGPAYWEEASRRLEKWIEDNHFEDKVEIVGFELRRK